ncbi:MAG: serine/threonine dehydratase [Actinomycetota bacterium]
MTARPDSSAPADADAPVPAHDDVVAAAERLAGLVRRTPVLDLAGEELGVPGRVLLKLELLQHVGVFKARGALNTLLSTAAPADGVVAASGGNHGAALAWAAGRAGVPARIYVPASSPTAKVDRVASFGADVVVVDGYYSDALAESERWAAERDVLRVHAYDTPSVVTGQGTLGLELAEQVPDASAVLVSCGGGGLYAGVALGLDGPTGGPAVVPVEPERCPTLHTAVAHGGPVRVEVGGVAADSMGAAVAGRIAYAVASDHGATPALVPDDAIVEARRVLWERCRVLAEPGGATALAALLSGSYRPEPGDTTVVVVSGGNHPDIPGS